MALKPDRIEFYHDINWYFDAIAERGGIASVVTAGSGGYPGDRRSVAAYAASPSGAKPVGILIHDVIDYDTNRQHENYYKAGHQDRIHTKSLVDRAGRYTTNMIPSGVSPAGGDDAYLAASGNISNVQASGAPRVGRWQTSKDQDGYASIQLELL